MADRNPSFFGPVLPQTADSEAFSREDRLRVNLCEAEVELRYALDLATRCLDCLTVDRREWTRAAAVAEQVSEQPLKAGQATFRTVMGVRIVAG